VGVEYAACFVVRDARFDLTDAVLAKLLAVLEDDPSVFGASRAVQPIERRLRSGAAPGVIQRSMSAASMETPRCRESFCLTYLVEDVDGAGLRHPLRMDLPEAYFSLHLYWRPTGLIWPSGENLDSPRVNCAACGGAIIEARATGGTIAHVPCTIAIATTCPDCGRDIRAEDYSFAVRPVDGTGRAERTHLIHRLGIQIDCGKCFVTNARLPLTLKSLAVVFEEALGTDVRAFGLVH
jgi:hypothetical protein